MEPGTFVQDPPHNHVDKDDEDREYARTFYIYETQKGKEKGIRFVKYSDTSIDSMDDKDIYGSNDIDATDYPPPNPTHIIQFMENCTPWVKALIRRTNKKLGLI